MKLGGACPVCTYVGLKRYEKTYYCTICRAWFDGEYTIEEMRDAWFEKVRHVRALNIAYHGKAVLAGIALRAIEAGDFVKVEKCLKAIQVRDIPMFK